MLPPSYKGSWEIQDLEFHLVQWWIPPPKKKEDTSGTGQIKKKNCNVYSWVAIVGVSLCHYVFEERAQILAKFLEEGNIQKMWCADYFLLIISTILAFPHLNLHYRAWTSTNHSFHIPCVASAKGKQWGCWKGGGIEKVCSLCNFGE
ncbi:unnamed protein product [Rangifer tarandus platyrhynchus]|uniref:Uncharacterized protein n=1 Tax=Rangifer tarandus platyrhynchus TaxID=3082113 RepID=A0AC59ZMR8_RANTA